MNRCQLCKGKISKSKKIKLCFDCEYSIVKEYREMKIEYAIQRKKEMANYCNELVLTDKDVRYAYGQKL